MPGARRLAGLVVVLVVLVGVVGVGGVSGATGLTRRQSATASTTPLLWPGGGRMLSAPSVVGGSVLGDGSLEMVGDTVTTQPASFNDAPPELSLRLFTFVPNDNGGFSAVLRFRVPIIVLHSWRDHVVRQTMTVVLAPPNGGARAVQLQADGTAMNGTFTSGKFAPSDPGTAVIAGNVVVFDIPAGFAVGSDWTVQAIVKVQADEPLHRNRPATGYAAGTSIVPVGLLTGARVPSTGFGVVDATTALTTTTNGASGTSGLRPLGVRLEGQGKELAAIVTLDDSPSKLSADNPHLDLEVAFSGFAMLEHAVTISWLPNGSQPVTSAQVSIDTLAVGDVPVTVSGNDVRFAFGSYTSRGSDPKPATPRLDTMKFHLPALPLGLDEAVSSVDGVTGPPLQPDTADLSINGPQLTVTAASTGVPAQGMIDAAGRFVAFNETDYYSGNVDEVGNVVIYRTSTVGAAVGSHRSVGGALTAGRRIPVKIDLGAFDPRNPPPVFRDVEFFKVSENVPEIPMPDFLDDPDEFDGLPEPPTQDEFDSFLNSEAADELPLPDPIADDPGVVGVDTSDGPAQGGGAQGGNPDWPDTPVVDSTSDLGNSATFAVRVTGGTFSFGNPIAVTTPWIVSSLITGAVGSTPPAPGVASTASKGGGGGGGGTIVVVAGAVAVLGGGALVMSRRRRGRTRRDV